MNEIACREIIEHLLNTTNPTREDVNLIKTKVAGEFGLRSIPSNSELIRHLKHGERSKLLPILKRKVIRTISGVTVIAVMTKPWQCPKENPCAYCPGGPPFGVPQSYTGYEPATMRGLENQFDPYRQVKNRIAQLRAIGHSVDKVEIIVMGGTFPSMPIDYQGSFVQRCIDAVTERKSESLDEAKKLAETSRVRRSKYIRRHL